MEAELRAGIAIYNAGGYHAAHDAWEDRWLELDTGTDDERFLHGLIQFTAAVYHAQDANWAGLRGLAESGSDYLDGLPADYRGVNVGAVRTYLRSLAADPEHVEREAPPALTVGGEALAPPDLAFEAAVVAAMVLAEELEGYDSSVVEQGIEFAREAVEAGDSDRFVALVLDFVADPDHRTLVYDRLRRHVEQRRAEVADVEGLFEE